MRNGAFDYSLLKPYSNDQLEVTLKKAENFNQLLKVNEYFSRAEEDDSGALCNSIGTERGHGRFAPVDPQSRPHAGNRANLRRERHGKGTREAAARFTHQSPRANAPFIKLNCAAVPENLIESEFFGHEKGAFTGAMAKREGRFELAHNGTILLDEISEISLQVQAKLLRVLQERELERVGGNRTIKVDVRVIATTNRHLEESVERKEFRQDLFFRLNVVPIPVPPLRERKEDVPFLAQKFMQRFSRKHGVCVQGISEDCLAALKSHYWPGNVRELQNVIERAVILCGDSGQLEAENLGFSPKAVHAPDSGGVAAASVPTTPGVQSAVLPAGGNDIVSLAELEKHHIFAALEKTGQRPHSGREVVGHQHPHPPQQAQRIRRS